MSQKMRGSKSILRHRSIARLSLGALLLVTMVAFPSTLAWTPVSTGILSTRVPLSTVDIKRRSFPQQFTSNTSSQSLVTLRASVVDASGTESDADKKGFQMPPLEPPPEEDSGLELKDKIINGLFLSAAFGYALYTIFSIDQGITRGWTASEIAMRIPLDNWGAYESYLANKPIVTKTLINVIIYLLGDWLSQTAFQGKNVLDFDIGRTFRNGFIGLCFGPLVHEYYQFSDTILPPENGLVTRLEKIFMDQTIYLTVKCSIYISAVGLLGGDDWPTVKKSVTDKIGGVVITAWKFWPLVHCITYGLIPARHRILWVNSVDLVWNAILASQAQKTEDDSDVEDLETQMLLVNETQVIQIEGSDQILQADALRVHEDTVDDPVSASSKNSTSTMAMH